MESSYRRLHDIASRFDTNNIFIIGKGPSIDEMDPSVVEQGLTININDSERIAKGQIAH